MGGVAATSIVIRTTPAPAKGRGRLHVRVTPKPAARKRRGAIRSVVRLGWSARPGATYYRVRIRRAGGRPGAPALEVWTVRPNVSIRLASPDEAPSLRAVPPGTYRWSVHPVSALRFGDGSPSRRPLVEGEFTLGA